MALLVKTWKRDNDQLDDTDERVEKVAVSRTGAYDANCRQRVDYYPYEKYYSFPGRRDLRAQSLELVLLEIHIFSLLFSLIQQCAGGALVVLLLRCCLWSVSHIEALFPESA